ncbi:endonuclease III [Sphingorhabdus sp. Alg239-R122]|uniref:endonuclease III domain-containing protein n=1 Tax=Sphingorhabdus sp. Alg239-R122 TaxID=2305989 RepID=UPI0013DD7BF7|nr:endonuclease III [Sphingorhabdus sp. Alg239-R122]
MQFDLGPDPRTETLERIQARLIDHFGRVRRPPEKRRDPVWTLVQGVIGARTKTAVSNENTDRMLARYGTWEKVADAPLEELTGMLRTATFPGLMAERLKACLTEIIAQRGSVMLHHLDNLPTEEAMAWLETLPGVARKIAAGVMNASTFNRRTLVLDTHHRRVMQRMGLVPAKADTARAYDALMPVLPKAWAPEDVDEHHLLVKRIGQNFCRPKRTDCVSCPVREDCQMGQCETQHSFKSNRIIQQWQI